MDRLVKDKNVFSGSNNKTDDFSSQKHPEMYYEGQKVNDQTEQEELKNEKNFVRDEKKGSFKAVYNMFF